MSLFWPCFKSSKVVIFCANWFSFVEFSSFNPHNPSRSNCQLISLEKQQEKKRLNSMSGYFGFFFLLALWRRKYTFLSLTDAFSALCVIFIGEEEKRIFLHHQLVNLSRSYLAKGNIDFLLVHVSKHLTKVLEYFCYFLATVNTKINPSLMTQQLFFIKYASFFLFCTHGCRTFRLVLSRSHKKEVHKNIGSFFAKILVFCSDFYFVQTLF